MFILFLKVLYHTIIKKITKMYSDDFVRKVKELYTKHQCYRLVGSILGIYHSTVRYIVINDYSRPKKKRGPRKKVSLRQKTKIKLEVKRLQNANQHVFAGKIKENCNIDASLRTVQRAMKELGLGYKKVPQKLPLTAKHKKGSSLPANG